MDGLSGEIDSRTSDELRFHYSIFADNEEQRDNAQIGNVQLLISIVTRHNRLGAKNTRGVISIEAREIRDCSMAR